MPHTRRIARRWFSSLLALASLGLASLGLAAGVAAQERPYDAASERAMRHATPEWQAIADHLPDPQTATPERLRTAADVLRARRLPEDALDYYHYALQRGGDAEKLQNCIGVTLLELRRYDEARTAF